MQVIDDFKALPILRVVHGANIGEMVERRFRRIVKKASHIKNSIGSYLDGDLGPRRIRLDAEHRLGKFRHQRFDQGLHDLSDEDLFPLDFFL